MHKLRKAQSLPPKGGPKAEGGSKDALTNPAGQMRSDPGSRKLPSKDKATDLRQGGLNRAAEKKRIKTGTSAKEASEGAKPSGWASSARQASIAARKAKAEQKRQMMESRLAEAKQ